MMRCAIDGCAKPLLACGLCVMHYRRLTRTGNVGEASRRIAAVGEPRRWLTEAVATRDRSEGCWLWPFSTSGTGYPTMHGPTPPVILALELDGRPKTNPKHEVCHSCDVRACVNPAHVRWDTHQANMREMVERGRWRTGARKRALTEVA